MFMVYIIYIYCAIRVHSAEKKEKVLWNKRLAKRIKDLHV